jgi:phage tail sheath protein FI
MPVTPTYPGLYIEELPSSAHTITPAPTSITAFVGYTHPFKGLCATTGTNGLWNQAIQIFNFVDYERMFGGLYQSSVVDGNVARAVYQFFLNGGNNAYVVALQPHWVTQTAGGALQTASMDPASAQVSSIKFTAKELTSDANPISITIRNVNNDTADILVTFGTTLELHRGVKVAAGPSTDKDLVQTRLGSSSLVEVEPVGAQYPGTFTAGSATIGDMTRPANAIGTFQAKDFTDAFDADSALDKVDIFNLLVVPGVTDNAVVANALRFCQDKRAFFIMDPAPNWSADDTYQQVGLSKVEDKVQNVPNTYPNGALYFPYLKTQDPLTSKIVEQPPSGFVAGVYARTDTNRGVWKAPAGLETSILNTTGVVESGRMTDMRQGTVNRLGVNVLRSFPGSGTVVWGARTIGTNPALEQWRYVPVRRMALFIENSLLRNLGWVVFEPNDEPLWTAIRISVDDFMLSLFRQQAFEGSTPSDAFRVLCDETTTTQNDIDNGIVNIVVGFRPLKPAEFVIIKIAQLAGQVQ